LTICAFHVHRYSRGIYMFTLYRSITHLLIKLIWLHRLVQYVLGGSQCTITQFC
jgi:hypothetical protein